MKGWVSCWRGCEHSDGEALSQQGADHDARVSCLHRAKGCGWHKQEGRLKPFPLTASKFMFIKPSSCTSSYSQFLLGAERETI